MKRQKMLWIRWLMGMAALCLFLTGCAAGTATGQSQAAAPGDVEEMLAGAGFKVIPADNPKRQAILQSVAPRQLVPQKKGQKMVYVYAVPEAQRLYVGDDAAYQRFINQAVLQKIEDRHRTVGGVRTDDPEFWTMWEDSQGR